MLCSQDKKYNKRYKIPFDDFYNKVTEYAHTSTMPVRDAMIYYNLPPIKTPWHKEDEVLFEQSKQVLIKLHNRGYRIGIIANQSAGTTDRLAAWGLMEYIQVVISSAEAGVEKPDLRIFQLAINEAECKYSEAVMIGDRLDNDIYPTKKCGMKTVRIRKGFSKYLELEQEEYQPDYDINELNELLEIFG